LVLKATYAVSQEEMRTGKSNYISVLVAGTLNTEDDDIDTLGTRIKANRQNKAVLLYDTEQSEL